MVAPDDGSSSHGWDLQFFRHLHDRELGNLANPTALLDQIHLIADLADTRTWLPDNSGSFSSKLAFRVIQGDHGIQDFQFYKDIWKSGIPSRIKFFAWTLSLGKINTHDILQRKRAFQCLSPSWCVMCKQHQETIPHLFLHCDFAMILWSKVFREFDLLLEILDNLLDLLKRCSSVRKNRKVKAIWVCVVWAVLWGIWKERNSRTFNDDYVSAFNVWDKILFWVAIWIMSHQDFSQISLSDLSMGWSFLL